MVWWLESSCCLMVSRRDPKPSRASRSTERRSAIFALALLDRDGGGVGSARDVLRRVRDGVLRDDERPLRRHGDRVVAGRLELKAAVRVRRGRAALVRRVFIV